MKHYSLREIQNEFSKLNKLQKIETLWNALEFAQSIGGSKWFCVASAMGYNYIDGTETFSKENKVKQYESENREGQ